MGSLPTGLFAETHGKGEGLSLLLSDLHSSVEPDRKILAKVLKSEEPLGTTRMTQLTLGYDKPRILKQYITKPCFCKY